MKLSRWLKRYSIAGLTVVAAALLLPSGIAAQTPVRDPYPVGPDGEPLVRSVRLAKMRLSGNKDVAYSDMRSIGFFKFTSCAQNDEAMCDNFALYQGDIGNGQESGSWFELSWRWGVPKTDWDSAKTRVPSLANVANGPSGASLAGWTVNDFFQSGVDDMNAADGSLGTHHAGLPNTGDRSCLDHGNSWGYGVPLLAGSNCPQTWGTEGWKGARPIPVEVFQARYTASPSLFNFDFWRVTDAEITAAGVAPATAANAGKTIGNFQAYGYTSDHTAEILCGTNTIRTYGNVIPAASQVVPGGCTGNPTRPGWPIGIDVRFDAFTFQLPALKDVLYFQVLFINRSQDVYGTGLDYDSLYIDWRNGWYHSEQRTMIYHVPAQGALYANRGPILPCQAARQVVDLTCATWGGLGSTKGFVSGAEAEIILKSPIGDLRNKWFSRVGSPFYNPAHPLAGDTLTYNHGHFCGFRSCTRQTASTNPATVPQHERWTFGLISSTEQNILAGRTSTSLGGTVPGQNYWHIFRAAGYGSGNPDCFYGEDPTLGMCWNRMVPPGNWDYNHDGVLDTLHLDGCFITGCAGLWSDSLPSIAGVTGKMPTYGNVGGVAGVGPIQLKAGDTTAFVVAITQARDSAGIMAQVAAAIDNYMNFFLAPDAAPKCRVTGVSRATPEQRATVTISWNTACMPGQWTDKFLAKQYTDMINAAPGSAIERLRQLNPWLKDTLLFLTTNNLANLYLFKSCDGGGTWTSDADCEGNEATGGPLKDLGFLPYATFSTAASLPVTITDLSVTPGLTYTYNLVGETRGANFSVINGDAVGLDANGDTVCTLGCRVETLALAPTLFNGLSASTSDPNVAQVYMAISRQAGARAARIEATDSVGPLSPSRVAFLITSDSLTPAQHRILFGNTASGTQVDRIDRATNGLKARTTQVVLVKGATNDTINGTNLGGFTPVGATAGAPTFVLDTAGALDDSVVTTTFAWTAGPVMALTREGIGGGTLLVSDGLTPGFTAGQFHTNPDYPNFDVSVDNTVANNFSTQFFTRADGSRVPGIVEPTVTFQNVSAQQNQTTASNTANGEYLIGWQDKPFGPGEQFRLNFTTPSASVTEIQNSLAARTVASTGATDTATARAISQALAQPSFTFDSLVAVKLPFTITNRSYARNVTVAMRRRPGKTILIGNTGQDTIRVPVADDIWVPSDTLFFVEPVNGVAQVTFQRAVIGCGNAFTRLSCNPVYPLTRGATTYLGESPGQVNHVLYNVPVTSASRFTFRAVAPLRGDSLNANTAAVRAGLAAIRVVPNPYVMLSQYPGNVLSFTHMPPRGVMRIYTVSGQFVQQITWTETDLNGDGDLTWNLRTREGNNLAAGLYIYVLTARDANDRPIGSRTDKFVIIR